MAFFSRRVLSSTGPAMRSHILELGMCRFSVSATTLADKPTASKGGKQTEAPSHAKPATPPPSEKGNTYKAQEIFNYNELSFYDIESAMRKHRLPQPAPGQPCN